MSELRKYGAATTILFPLIDAGAVDFESTPVTFASGDTKISKNEGAFANTGSNPAHEGNGIYSLALTATEMQAARISIIVIDQTATKTWEDQAVIIDTYGHASAQHAFDLDLAEQLVALSAQGKLDVNAEADTALTDYDPPTGAELVSEIDAVQADIAALNDPAATAIADAVLRRPTSDVESGWTEDARTLYGVVASLMHKAERDGTDANIILYKSDDTTVLVTIPITKDATLDPIQVVDPPA